ncbi:DUF7289 family protein [Haloprofundus salinisoli]|uniref:DUF7289 family protein n=1 Tax=Haloprofundus salinisoli TaxID=2876193 RepID=UPI001CCFBDCC|nr:hypothetical protein [Haloprofundus salinisoli]
MQESRPARERRLARETRRGDRAQSELIGVVLLFGLVVAGTAAVVALGGVAIDDAKSHSEFDRAEQVMTLFDSKAATVALGDSEVKTVSLGRSGGQYVVDESSGRLTIVHENYDGAGSDETLYDEPLGAVVYHAADGGTIAYQGGGVWSAPADGGATMVSPPEFHYRDGTLTLPVVRATGTSTTSGASSARIKAQSRGDRVYPDSSATYGEDEDGARRYVNPVENGRVVVKVQSEYYRAWAEFFRSRTEGEVEVYPGTQTATVALVTLGTNGDFRMPAERGSIDVRGMAEHTLDDFSIALRPDDSDSANFNNLQWSLAAEEGDQQFEIHLRKTGSSGCDIAISTSVYYSDDGGDTYHGWYDDDAFTTHCEDLDGDGDNEVLLDADFVDNGASLTYKKLQKSELMHFKPGELRESVTFDEHEADSGETYTAGENDELPLSTLVSHYFSLLSPSFELIVYDKNSNTISESVSSGRVVYSGDENYVTYLQVSESEVVVELD